MMMIRSPTQSETHARGQFSWIVTLAWERRSKVGFKTFRFTSVDWRGLSGIYFQCVSQVPAAASEDRQVVAMGPPPGPCAWERAFLSTYTACTYNSISVYICLCECVPVCKHTCTLHMQAYMICIGYIYIYIYKKRKIVIYLCACINAYKSYTRNIRDSSSMDALRPGISILMWNFCRINFGRFLAFRYLNHSSAYILRPVKGASPSLDRKSVV